MTQTTSTDKSRFPSGAQFAFTILDDTDDSTLENARPVYDRLTELGIRTTKTVWPIDCPEGSRLFFAADTLERCVEALERDPSVILSLTRTEFIDSKGKKLGEYDFPLDLSTASPRDVFRLYTLAGHINFEIFGVFRAAALRETPLIGSYVGSDLVLLGRLALRGRLHQVPEKLFLHREHPERLTRATGGAGGYTQWFDPSRSGCYAMPFWRRLLENSRSVARAPRRKQPESRKQCRREEISETPGSGR